MEKESKKRCVEILEHLRSMMANIAALPYQDKLEDRCRYINNSLQILSLDIKENLIEKQ